MEGQDISKTKFKELSDKSEAIVTLNKYGIMTHIENPHFKYSLKLMDKSKPVADLGTAYGCTSKVLLDNNFRVVANDLDERHIQVLWDNLSEDERKRTTLKPGNALDIQIEKSSLAGIIALRWVHFLSGDQLRQAFKTFYDWLAPNGIFVVSVMTPTSYAFYTKEKYDYVEKVYAERLKNELEWPGEFESKDVFPNQNDLLKNFPEKMNVFEAELLIREINFAGFKLIKAEYFDYDVINKTVQRDGVYNMELSLICMKRE